MPGEQFPKKCHPSTAPLFLLTEPDGIYRLPGIPATASEVIDSEKYEMCPREVRMCPREKQRSSETLNGAEGGAGNQRWGVDSNRDQWGLNATVPRRGEGADPGPF